MPRVEVTLDTAEGRANVKAGKWRRGMGLVPGEPNQGLVAELESSPARLLDYDDSGWDEVESVRELVSQGFTFAWWRITVEIPESLDGLQLAGANTLFETNVDNYGEVYFDGQIELVPGAVVGFH